MVTSEINIEQIREKVDARERLSEAEGLYLARDAELLDLVPLAQAARNHHNPNNLVTYVVDTNLNYTNLCNAYCSFCAFYRTDPNDPFGVHLHGGADNGEDWSSG